MSSVARAFRWLSLSLGHETRLRHAVLNLFSKGRVVSKVIVDVSFSSFILFPEVRQDGGLQELGLGLVGGEKETLFLLDTIVSISFIRLPNNGGCEDVNTVSSHQLSDRAFKSYRCRNSRTDLFCARPFRNDFFSKSTALLPGPERFLKLQ